MFKKIFTAALAAITSNRPLIENLWLEIETEYTRPHRHYHTLVHLDHIATELMPVREKVQDWQTLVLSIAYHDVVYDPQKSDNEGMSAAFACNRLTQLSLSNAQKQKCSEQIMATKAHNFSSDTDTNYFTDADLCILGADAATYQQYALNIRKEYQHYPDAVYKEGRQKVLQHFLQMENIFKTAHFRNKYEQQAKQNLKLELHTLS